MNTRTQSVEDQQLGTIALTMLQRDKKSAFRVCAQRHIL
jgi:hypothetical protein